MINVEAAVGLVQLKKYPSIISQRRDIALTYSRSIKMRAGWQLPPIISGATYSHYVVRVPNRSSVVAEFALKGVHLGELIQYTIPELSSYRDPHSPTKPNSLRASKEVINFPLSKFVR